MDLALSVICAVTLVSMVVVVAAAVTSWFAVQPGTVVERVALLLQAAVDPVLAPLRTRLPQPQLAGLPIDLSPIVVLLVLWAIRLLIGC